jgi:hypothetical protein
MLPYMLPSTVYMISNVASGVAGTAQFGKVFGRGRVLFTVGHREVHH